MLCTVTIFTLLPIEAFANSGLWQAGVSTGSSTSGGSGTWLTKQQGYRISVIDPKTAATVTDKVDFVFGTTPERAVYCSNNKIESFTADNSVYEAMTLRNLRIISVNDSNLIAEFKAPGRNINPNWPKHTLWTTGAQSNDEFDDWFLKGKLSGKGGNSKPPISYTGGGSSANSNRKPTGSKPNGGSTSGSTGGSNPSNPGSSGSSNSVSSKCSEIRNAMKREFDLKFKAGMNRGAAAAAAEKVGYGIVCDLELADSFTPDELQRFNAEVKKYANHLAAPDSAAGSVSVSPLSPAYDKIKENQDGSFWFDMAYATQDSDFDSTQDGAAYVIMNFKQDGNFVFAFNNGETAHTNANGTPSIIQTICDNGYYILVEPVLWFTPEKYRRSPEPKHYDPYMKGEIFYGTPTNYAQFAQDVLNNNVWTDGGSGGNYGNLCNKVGAHTLHLAPTETLYKQDSSGNPTTEVLIGGVSTTNSIIKNAVLQDSAKGYAVHYYWGEGGGGFTPPRTQTYDPFEKDPNPDPHTAPNPDPNYTAPNGKTPVPFTDGEPTHPYQDADHRDLGYQDLTRTVNIVKCYDIERIDGTLEHVITKATSWHPGTIAVMHEPDYKAVGWFTSPYYIGYELFQDQTQFIYPGESDGLFLHNGRIPYQRIDGGWDKVHSGLMDEWSDDDTGKAAWTRELDTSWEGMRTWSKTILNSPYNNLGITAKFDKTIEYNEKGKAGETVGTVQIGVVADLEYTEEKEAAGEKPKDGYDDTTLYVHLIKKEKIPETSTWDEPEYPPSGKPPVVPPNAPPDPFDPPITDPETDPPEDSFSHYRIVKVYETEDDATGKIDTDAILHRFPTNPIVYIEDEAQPGKPDNSYHLIEWQYGDEFNGVKWNKNDESPNGTDWDSVVAGVNAKGAGTTESRVDLIDKENQEETVTLYVRLRRKVGPRLPGEIIIEQSQISKTIHSNDKNIGGRFGNYRFAMTVNFPHTHTTHFYHGCCQKRYGTDSEGNTYVIHDCGKCHGHTCTMHMPGPNTDPDVNFIYDETSDQDQLEIKLGVNKQTDSKVYGKSGSSGTSKAEAIQYPEKIKDLNAEPNKYYYTSNGKDKNGAEYVTILWRGHDGYKDVPTLAKYKESDIKLTFGSADNYNVPKDVLNSGGTTPDRKSQKKRASAPWLGELNFEFGIRGDSDLTGNSACDDIKGEYGTPCIHKDFKDYYPIEGTEFKYDFKATVAIQFYAGQAKGLQAAPFGGKASTPILEKKTGNHKELNVIQCKQIIKFYPYIRMTYMVNSLDDAIKEEQNIYETGYKQDVRKDTYVLSEWESQVLPSDAVRVEWQKGGADENLLLTSQQWSVHQKAVNGGQVWNGKNQVLPGGAIYQLSTPKGDWVKMGLTTYQTVIDQKARNEYLTASNTLSGDEYTEAKVAKDHLDFINDAKEVLDNLKVVQWVNRNAGASKTWTDNFKPDPQNGIIKILDGLEISSIDLSKLRDGSKTHPNDDEKYYMRQQTQFSNYQSSKLSEWTKTIDESQGIKEQSYEGDLDIFNFEHTTTVFKLFTDTSGNVYLAQMEKKYPANDKGVDSNEQDIKSMVQSMQELDYDTYAKGQTGGATVTKLCDKKVPGSGINGRLSGDAKDIDDATKFITNFVSSLTRNKGSDYTAEWAKDLTDGKWYNEAFDGAYLVRQKAVFNVGFAFSSTRTSALDPALCPQNKGQSDLYTKAFLSQFCTDSQSDAAVAQGKKQNYLGTFKDTDITLPDMESLYISKKFYIPNANVQDLN